MILTPKMEENPKHFWKFIKGKRQDNTGIATLRQNGKLKSDPQTKAEILNGYFESVLPGKPSSISQQWMAKPSQPYLSLR